MNPEYFFLGAVVIGLLLALYALRHQTTAEVADDVIDLRRRIETQENQISLLLDKMADMQLEITRLRVSLDMQTKENDLLNGKMRQYREKLSNLGLSDK